MDKELRKILKDINKNSATTIRVNRETNVRGGMSEVKFKIGIDCREKIKNKLRKILDKK